MTFRYLPHVVLIFAVSGQLCPAAETPPRQNRMVHRVDDQIVDGSGRPLKLRGVNLGGWLLWEPWMWGGHLDASESKLSGRLEGIVGPAEAARFREAVYDNFITEADIRRIGELGFNVVRVPMNSSIFNGDTGWRILDGLISWAEKYHVYLVLDLHSAPGGQSAVFTSDPQGRGQLWNSTNNQARTVELWKTIAGRYRNRAIIAAYDVLNEPDAPGGDQLLSLYRRVIAGIREVDSSHLIFLEGGRFASDFSMFSGSLSGNEAYSFHMYTLKRDDRAQRLDSYRRLAKTQRIPLWCGEFGVNTYEMIESTVGLFDRPENDVVGWAYWTWKRAPTNNPSLMSIKLSPLWSHLIERASSPLGLGEPSRMQALAAMKEFVSAIRLENNIEDPRMTSILTGAAKR